MPSPRVPVFKTILSAWADAFRAIGAMPIVALVALVILAGVGVVSWWISTTVLLAPGRTVQQWVASPSWFVLSLINTSLEIVLLAPLAMAVHRFVIRGDVARGYPLNLLRPSYLRYVGAMLVLNLAYNAPALIRFALPAGFEAVIVVPTLLLMIVVAIAALRKIALFPAIAVNAPNATWHGVSSADAGNTVRIILVALAIWLPSTFYAWLVTAYFPPPRSAGDASGVVLALLVWLPQLLIISAFAAAAARTYMALAEPVEALAVRAERPVVA